MCLEGESALESVKRLEKRVDELVAILIEIKNELPINIRELKAIELKNLENPK